MNKPFLFILLFLSVFTVSSCMDDAFYISTHDMKHNHWRKGDSAVFDIEITDTSAYYDISAALRCSDGYPWSNIYVFSSLADSTAVIASDTVMCELFDSHGHPTGHGLSNVKENIIPLWDKYMFPHAGTYSVSLTHGMRNIELSGVSSISLHVEKTDIKDIEE